MSNPFNDPSLSPTILVVSESTHYLVGATDLKGNFYQVNDTRNHRAIKSLSEAKQCLLKNGIRSAFLQFESAYDEVIGNETKGTVKQKIRF